jgi:hypothetical protein
MDERRRRRGETLEAALSYQLAACVEDEGLSGMVLADDQGLCLAGWGRPEVCEEVAARAPLGRAVDGARRLRFGGIELFLCAMGGEPPARGRSLDRSAAAIERILGRWIAT